MAGGGDPTNAMAGATGAAQAFGYGQNVAPEASFVGQSSQLPLWQQGLLGALTGDRAYGQNAPAIHKALTGMLGQQQQKGAPAPLPMTRRMPVGVPGITQFTGITPQTGNVSPAFGGAPHVPSVAPWMMGGM